MKIDRRLFWGVLFALIALIVALLVWDSRERASRADKATHATGVTAPGPGFAIDQAAMDCPTPFADQAHPDVPLQGGTDGLPKAFVLAEGSATPVAPFAVEGRVLGRKNYDADRESSFAPTDIAFGWSRMRDPAVLAKLNIKQSSRWYHYNWTGEPPIPVQEIVRSSANMHMIPANPRIAEALSEVERDAIVRIDGFLVTVKDGRGWAWHSSTTREDSGAGACEVVYVCRVRVTSN